MRDYLLHAFLRPFLVSLFEGFDMFNNFLISNAHAAPAAPGGDLMSFLPMIFIFVLFYFMLIRPQMKQAKEQKAMIEALKAGDEVATAGGVIGKVTKVSDAYISIEIAANTVINVQKHTVQTMLPPGTIKSI
jgi:preprotein translocase subunit YajC